MQIKIFGGSFHVISSLTAEQLQSLAKYAPSALVIKDEDGNEIFKESYSASNGGICKFGIVYESVNNEGLAMSSFTFPEDAGTSAEEKKAYITDKYMQVKAYIEELETKAVQALADVNAQRAAFAGAIEVLG